jgi:hypothetical protein
MISVPLLVNVPDVCDTDAVGLEKLSIAATGLERMLKSDA